MYSATCLCQAVTFEIGELFYGRFCHCENCRKYAGTSPAAWIAAEANSLMVLSGESLVTKYETETRRRCFCSVCGSPLWSEINEYPELLGIPCGVLNERDLPKPELQVWAQSKVPWCRVADDLPIHNTTPQMD